MHGENQVSSDVTQAGADKYATGWATQTPAWYICITGTFSPTTTTSMVLVEGWEGKGGGAPLLLFYLERRAWSFLLGPKLGPIFYMAKNNPC
ncbi:MAG: hypothetical protein EA402_04515, partial [Planctomycetota bacterium]